MTENPIVCCEGGHVFELTDFSPPAEVIAAISFDPSEVPHAPAGLIYECGERVVWKRSEGKPKRRARLKFRRPIQLDLFDPLDKPDPS